MLFQPTYALSRDAVELEREAMFALEQAFSFHDAAVMPRVSVDTAHLGDSRLCRVRSTGHTISLSEPACVTLLVPRRGRMVVETASGAFTAAPGDMLFFAPNRRVTHVIPDSDGRFESHCALIAIDDLPADSGPQADSMERRFASTKAGRSALRLKRLLAHFFEEGFQASSSLTSDRARDAARVLLAEAAHTVIDEQADSAPRRSLPSRGDHNLVRRAEEIMRDRYYYQALSTRGIAESMGVSPRRVQVAFLNASGASPLDALRAVRLEIARERLLNASDGDTVTGIAMECGFFHLGRFSRTYAEAFGETPSQTLSRALR